MVTEDMKNVSDIKEVLSQGSEAAQARNKVSKQNRAPSFLQELNVAWITPRMQNSPVNFIEIKTLIFFIFNKMESKKVTELNSTVPRPSAALRPKKSSNKKYHCEHGSRKYICIECGGSQISVHGRIKYKCKDCQGSLICVHGKKKYRCINCDCRELCSHNIIKYKCKECDGRELCSHSRQKSFCKNCKGSQICSHNRQKSFCKKCNNPIKVTIQN